VPGSFLCFELLFDSIDSLAVIDRLNLQIHSAAGDLAALLEAVGRVTVLILAKHEVLVVVFAVGANEEGGGLERGRGGTDFRMGAVSWCRSGVDKFAGGEGCFTVGGHGGWFLMMRRETELQQREVGL